ncbi:hypothetical protein LZM68_18740, partial [Pseudomonas aeruginosa]|nr:hypothetical protein [Pseudomonas aeruginosa]
FIRPEEVAELVWYLCGPQAEAITGAELAQASASEALAWGVAHWDATRIPRCATLPEERL